MVGKYAGTGSLLATAGAPTQLLITPYDDYGNVANITSLEALQLTVVAEGTSQGRSLKAAGDGTAVQVTSTLFCSCSQTDLAKPPQQDPETPVLNLLKT
jgi:hypothetical protein